MCAQGVVTRDEPPEFPLAHAAGVSEPGRRLDSERVARLTCDHVLFDPEAGRVRLIEAMYSGVIRLDLDFAEVAARVHPVKQQLFDRVIAGDRIEVTLTDPEGRNGDWIVDDHIELHVSSPDGPVTLSYADVAGQHRRVVTDETTASGFDPDAEPVLRRMRDGSLRLVFCSLPPARHRLGSRFDLEHFGESVIGEAGPEIAWDDRDVFLLPYATEAQLRAVLRYVEAYEGA